MRYLVTLAALVVLVAPSKATAQSDDDEEPIEQTIAEDEIAHAAAPSPELRDSDSRSTYVWYGGEIMLMDLATAGTIVIAAGLGDDGTALAWVGALGFIGGPAIIHAARHGRGGAATGSMILRVGLPLVAACVGAEIEKQECEGELLCGLGGLAKGAMVGVASAVIIDAALLSWKSESSDTRRGLAFAPLPLKNGGGLMLGGRF